MGRRPKLLIVVPSGLAPLWEPWLREGPFDTLVHERDAYRREGIDYVLSFRPPHGFLATLPNLKTVFSLGAGIDAFLADPALPKTVPLVRFVDPQLSTEMAQYVVMHILLQHRSQREFDTAQAEHRWAQRLLARKTSDTRIGILGLGEIGTMAAERLRDLGFAVAGWSRSAKTVAGVESFAGEEGFAPFLARSDYLVCLLPLTDETRGILNAKTFALLPKGAYVINVARGGHLAESELIAALDSGQLSGATLDVFATEPLPPEDPLWAHPKVTVTPHIAAISDPAVAARFVIEGVARAERGERDPYTVDWGRGY
ncbi:MAG: glyoxylate/hydroxypyruvate reductase A [Alphaproteobacteria bacterium]|nr:glyoxylate/hydroxypyruvate reductase A [Alphaproteobacteria bacterium]